MSKSKERQAAWRDRMRERGLEQVPVWVPTKCREMIRDIARCMRELPKLNRAIKEANDRKD